MNFYDAGQLADDAKVTISGKDLKNLMDKALIMGAGYAPKSPELLKIWASSFRETVQSATLVINTGIPNV